MFISPLWRSLPLVCVLWVYKEAMFRPLTFVFLPRQLPVSLQGLRNVCFSLSVAFFQFLFRLHVFVFRLCLPVVSLRLFWFVFPFFPLFRRHFLIRLFVRVKTKAIYVLSPLVLYFIVPRLGFTPRCYIFLLEGKLITFTCDPKFLHRSLIIPLVFRLTWVYIFWRYERFLDILLGLEMMTWVRRSGKKI